MPGAAKRFKKQSYQFFWPAKPFVETVSPKRLSLKKKKKKKSRIKSEQSVQKKWSTSEKSFFWPKLPFLSSRCGTLAQNEFDLSNRIMNVALNRIFI